MSKGFDFLRKWAGRVSASPKLCGALILLLVTAVYGEVCSFHFLPFWDDDTNIHRNPLYSPLSWKSIALFWEGPFQQLYIPVTYSAWGGMVALSRLLAGTSITLGPLNAAIFHGANLLVHLVSTLTVFLILRRLLEARFGKRTAKAKKGLSSERLVAVSAAGALAYALHPVQVESVAWVSGLRDLMGGAFSLLSLSCFLVFLEERRPWRRCVSYLLATLLLLLAFGSKPGSVVTPALALLLGGWLLQARHASYNRLFWLFPWFLLALAEVMMTSKSQPAAELASSLVPVWARPLVACDALAFYLGKILFPFGLCADYGRAPNWAFSSSFLAWTWIFPVGLTALFVSVQRLRPYLVAWGVFVIGLLPTLGFIPFNFQIVSTVSDHYLYLAMFGFALGFALLLIQIPDKAAVSLVILAIPFWSILTLFRLPDWSDGNTFFPATLSCNPWSWKSRHNYACTLDAQNKGQEALRQFEEAIRLRPSNAEAHNDMAITLMKMGRNQEAIRALQQSLQIRPTAGAARNLASLFQMTGDPQQAIQAYRFAMKVDPSDLQNQRALAWLLATHPDDRVRNGEEAVQLARQIVEATNAKVPLFLLTLSVALAETKDFDQAVLVAEQTRQVYLNTGDPNMALLVEQQILPALKSHQGVRDNPVRQ